MRQNSPGLRRASLFALLSATASLWCAPASAVSLDEERASVEQWRTGRISRLTSETGWLTLAGLFWLKEGENSFGSSPKNAVALDNPALQDITGSFVRSGNSVKFVARPGSNVTLDGKPVTTVEMATDKSGKPTILAAGSLRFFIIQRTGGMGVRVRDLENPRRKHFQGIEYFEIDPAWVFEARFEPYEPHRTVTIMDIVGMEQNFDCPGALVFSKNGKEYRLDAVLEAPEDKELFIMFADGTSGRETYGAGRFMYVPFPVNDKIPLDFNKAYNPPCAFNDFATCPLPPLQNRLKVRIEAGEKKYAGGH